MTINCIDALSDFIYGQKLCLIQQKYVDSISISQI